MMIPNKEPFFISGKRKYLFYTDQKGISLIQPIMEELKGKNTPYEVVTKDGDLQSLDITKWLSEQKMGSYLYASLPWDEMYTFIHLVESIGFTNEEYQFIGYGKQTIKVFCCRCHGVTEGKELKLDQNITCQHCQLLIAISDHYSQIKNAYLGLVAKL